MIELNAQARLLAGEEVIAPSESFRDENKADLGERQSQSFEKREKSVDPVKQKNVESASTPAGKSEGDSADVMYACGDQSQMFTQALAIASRLMTEDDSLTKQMENANSTAVAEDPFPVEQDAESTHDGNTSIEVEFASSTHDQGMNLESAPSMVECVEADSTHMDDTYCERSVQAAYRLTASAGSTALDNITPVSRIVGPDVDENYLNVRGENEQLADANPAMFGNGEQPLAGIGG